MPIATSPVQRLLATLPRTTEQNIFTLASTWENAIRVATKSTRPVLHFFSDRPWQSRLKVDRTRWEHFSRLYAFLTEHQIPAEEFCTAVAQLHAKLNRRPNPRQVTGNWGIKIWQEWRTRRQAEGNFGAQGEARVQAAATTGTHTQEAEYRATVAQAYYDCQQFDLFQAPSRLWGPEVMWLFLITEPAARRPIHLFLHTLPDQEEWYSAIRAVQAHPAKSQLLLNVRRTITNTPAPILRSAEHIL